MISTIIGTIVSLFYQIYLLKHTDIFLLLLILDPIWIWTFFLKRNSALIVVLNVTVTVASSTMNTANTIGNVCLFRFFF
jgi:uncharacterized membrane protein YccC